MADQKYIIGIDVGGTFTDLLCLNTETQELLSEKVPSIPGSQWKGVLGALEQLGRIDRIFIVTIDSPKQGRGRRTISHGV